MSGQEQKEAVERPEAIEAIEAIVAKSPPTATNQSTAIPQSDNPKPLNHIQAARTRQGLSIRCVARRMGLTTAVVREQENENSDLLLSELYAWQAALEVPLEELLREPDDTLSPRVLDRARMLRVMKTVQALRAGTRTASQKRLAETLVGQLVDMMPELKSVTAWPAVGQRRTGEEMGRIVDNPISEQWLHEAG